jgi:hypothetical protein
VNVVARSLTVFFPLCDEEANLEGVAHVAVETSCGSDSVGRSS